MRSRCLNFSKRFFSVIMLLGFILSLWLHGAVAQAQLPRQASDSISVNSSPTTLPSPGPSSPLLPWMTEAQALMAKALVAQQAGRWNQAEASMTQSIALLQQHLQQGSQEPQHWKFLGQALNIRGSLELNQGKHQQALESWKAATEAYTTAKYEKGKFLTQINQAQALRELGFHRRALKLMEAVIANLEATTADPSLQAIALQRQGDLLRLIGDTKQSQQVLEASLALGQAMAQSPQRPIAQTQTAQTPTAQTATAPSSENSAISGQTLFSLGNTARAQGDEQTALAFYQQAEDTDLSLPSQVQIQLSQLQLLLQQEKWKEAQQLSPIIYQQLNQLPPNYGKVHYQINLAESLLVLHSQGQAEPLRQQDIVDLLNTAASQARKLGDLRIQAYAVGVTGHLYESNQQWQRAQQITQEAIGLAEAAQAPEILYQLYWQQARICQAQGQSELAIAHNRQAVQIIQSLRSDLVSTGSDRQFSFQNSIEPVYQNLLKLLLQTSSSLDPEQEQERLAETIDVIDSLRLAELENFLKKACDRSAPVDSVDETAAIIYPIILDEQLEIILSLPHRPLQHYSTAISKQAFEQILKAYRYNLVIRSQRKFYEPAQQLHDLLIQPIKAELKESGVKTLVFVPDSTLNKVPMAALYDGEHFLVETYNIALTPSLRLLGPTPLSTDDLSSLAVGISKAHHGFNALQHVVTELDSIKATLPNSTIQLDQAFTASGFTSAIKNLASPILHMATHGQFSSDAEQTFLLAWDQVISLKQFDQILRQAPNDIELLILSACETAQGDRKAALGLTGVAVEAGAQSTVATLWSVDDEASATFMHQFYQNLIEPQLSRAETLRQAQLSLLEDADHRHPFYWAPYIIVGSWI